MKLLFGAILFLSTMVDAAFGNTLQQHPDTIKLPDPLTFQNGKKVQTPKQWRTGRREEIIQIFRKEMYGSAPGRPAKMKWKEFEKDVPALEGIAKRSQITVFFTGDEAGPSMDILLYLPAKSKGPSPIFLELNFQGNHAVNADLGIRLNKNWIYGGNKGVVNNKATDSARGKAASVLPVEMILKQGYGIATIYSGDIDPDFNDGFKNGVQSLYPQLQNIPDNFSTMSAWAWGLSRAMDYFETDKRINKRQVAVIGFSRMGKAALWAGANDERFAMVVSNESGAGGAKIFRRAKGESVSRLNTKFPHWFSNRFKSYSEKDSILPFDQHMLLSLIAPRPLYVSSAVDDLNSDPAGEFLGAHEASKVYRFLGTRGLPTDTLPAIDQPVMGRIGYHIRTGKHDLTPFDWKQFLDFADKEMLHKPETILLR